MIFKTVFGDDIRRINVDINNYNEFLDLVKTIYKIKNMEDFTFYYFDKDNDRITISSNDDIQYAFEYFNEEEIMKIFIVHKSSYSSSSSSNSDPKKINQNVNNRIKHGENEESPLNQDITNIVKEVLQQIDLNELVKTLTPKVVDLCFSSNIKVTEKQEIGFNTEKEEFKHQIFDQSSPHSSLFLSVSDLSKLSASLNDDTHKIDDRDDDEQENFEDILTISKEEEDMFDFEMNDEREFSEEQANKLIDEYRKNIMYDNIDDNLESIYNNLVEIGQDEVEENGELQFIDIENLKLNLNEDKNNDIDNNDNNNNNSVDKIKEEENKDHNDDEFGDFVLIDDSQKAGEKESIINFFHSMGFDNDEQLIKLIDMYKGNIDKIIQILVPLSE